MGKVLVVDDTTGVHEMLRALFSTIGVDDVYTTSAVDAIEIYRGGGIDVVLTDIRMEEMDGISLLRKLKKMDPNCVVILMTAIDRKDDVLAALKLGAFDFFVKPFLVNEFTASLKRAFTERSRLVAMSESGGAGAALADAGLGAAELEQLKEIRRQIDERREQLALEEFELEERRRSFEQRIEEFEKRDAEVRKRADEIEKSKAAFAAEVKQRLAVVEAREAEAREAQARIEAQLLALDEAGLSVGGAAAGAAGGGSLSDEEFERRMRTLDEREEQLAEREAFLEQSENALFDKGQQIQELETELEHRRDELDRRERQIAERAAASGGSGGGSGLSAEDAAEIERIRAEMEKHAAELSMREAAIKKRERNLSKAEALIRAREKYLQVSESILFERENEAR